MRKPVTLSQVVRAGTDTLPELRLLSVSEDGVIFAVDGAAHRMGWRLLGAWAGVVPGELTGASADVQAAYRSVYDAAEEQPTDRSGLWWAYRRVLAAFCPTIAIVENVASGKSRWLCPVRRSLHELGYDTAALQIAARDVGAPHIRERIFVVAHRARPGSQGAGVRRRLAGSGGGEMADTHSARRDLGSGTRDEHAGGAEPADGHPRRGRRGPHDVGDADGAGREALGRAGQLDARERQEVGNDVDGCRGPRGEEDVRRTIAEPGMGRGVDGVPAGVDRDPGLALRWPAGFGEPQRSWEPPRSAARIPHRDERLMALGNAVVPQCAEEVGRWILQNL